MAKLYLHIGSHKTGTTSLQRALSHHLTAGQGVAYVPLRRGSARVVTITGAGESFAAELNLKKINRAFANAIAQQPDIHTFVTSEENFFWLNSAEEIAGLAKVLKRHFDEVRVVCYLRRQDQLALAHRKQVVEGHAAMKFYGLDTQPLPVFHAYMRKYFNYAVKLGQGWAPAFGKKNIILRPFERSRLKDGDVLADFSAATGIAFDANTDVEVNVSMAGNQTYLGLVMAKDGVDKDMRRNIFARMKGEGKYLPTQAEARAFQAHFNQANERLAKHWTIGDQPFSFDDSFDMYPEAAILPKWDYSDLAEDLARLLSPEALKDLTNPSPRPSVSAIEADD